MPDLITLAALKAWLSIADDLTDSDTVLSGVITQTSADFLREIDRADFMAADYVERREGDGDQRLAMYHWPINTIASIAIAGSPVTASTDGSDGFYFDADLDPERRSQIYIAGTGAFTDTQPIVVSYNAGYEDAPDDVVQALIDWCALRYRGRPGIGVQSEREAGGEHVVFDRNAAMPATTAGVAARYKRTWASLDKRNDDRDYRVTRINKTTTVTEKAS